ncbi:MAG: excinuclease ABC subunit UvrB, partial [Oligoflexales bacterium]|nr:excinuclease ABC subunit UvrB [Oligoflexales bacterium]
LKVGARNQTLLGVTGSGKTFTMAKVIAETGRPAIIIAPNKTLAAQLFSELKGFFPNSAVEFFISYYDYYQPEAYLPSSDTYIAKDSSINDDIDKMRHRATQMLFERKDVIIVASVSCIYGLGSPEAYSELVVKAAIGQEISRDKLLRALIDIQYSRNDMNLVRGSFRVRGDIIDILPSHQESEMVRIELFGDEIERLAIHDSLSGRVIRELDDIAIYPNSHYVADRKDMAKIVREILSDLGTRLREFKSQNKLVEAQRLEQRTMHDVELLEQLGFCPGIENYSRYLTGAKPGQPPPTLLDYFPKNFLTFIDESHITVPQIGAMYRGDRARKTNLVEFGFRLPSALDNRPLNFIEFIERTGQTIFVSATPGQYEQEHSKIIVEQIIRPTGLIDPEIEVRPSLNQVDDLYDSIKKTVAKNQRVLITTLTKKMAEDLTDYYLNYNVRVRYLHSDIDSLRRIELLRDLRKGEFDVLVGINLLREGLDLPEVGLVAVLDADREGFLRSKTSLIQIVGRAARNSESRVVFYADSITPSMQACMDETARRRSIQRQHNEKFNVTPKTIIKELPQNIKDIYGLGSGVQLEKLELSDVKSTADLQKSIAAKEKQMKKAAQALEFEKAGELRDEIRQLKDLLLLAEGSPLGLDSDV